jgi:hypothetical protein
MKELVVVKNLSTKVVGYRAGEDRNPRTYDWRPKASHTYAMMADGELWPMCGYGWNRSDGHALLNIAAASRHRRQLQAVRQKCSSGQASSDGWLPS